MFPSLCQIKTIAKNNTLKYLIKSGMYFEWAYFVDFEKKTFETWASGTFIEEVSLESLSKDEAEAYLELMTEKGSKDEGDYVSYTTYGDSDSD
jgi:hypothetical protein